MAHNEFASAVITETDWQEDLDNQCQQLSTQLTGRINLVVVFASGHFQSELEEIVQNIQTQLAPQHMIGGTGESIVADETELEDTPAISIWCASIPDTQISSMRLTFERTPDGGTFIGWPDDWSADSDSFIDEQSIMLLVGEPFSFPADGLLNRLEEDYPRLQAVGGMASGFHSPGENRIIVNSEVYNNGAAVVVLQGGVRMRTIVSQGCRPIGERYVITAAEGNMITGLGGKPALEVLRRIYDDLPTTEQAAMQNGFHIGRVVSEYQDDYQMGDFLIRNVVGVDPEQKAVVVADFLRVGQTVQFHIRDQESASIELKQLLSQVEAPCAAALLFTCNGRGTRLFEVESHDASALTNQFGNIPVTGLFAQGEIGPVGGKNFLHGFTASIIVFES